VLGLDEGGAAEVPDILAARPSACSRSGVAARLGPNNRDRTTGAKTISETGVEADVWPERPRREGHSLSTTQGRAF